MFLSLHDFKYSSVIFILPRAPRPDVMTGEYSKNPVVRRVARGGVDARAAAAPADGGSDQHPGGEVKISEEEGGKG